jgi:hypothetical protein
MATANQNSDLPLAPVRSAPGLLVLLASMPLEESEKVVANLTSSFSAESLMIATADTLPGDLWPGLRILTIPEANPSWTLTAADFELAYRLAGENEAGAILMLGPGSGSLRSSGLRDLANAVIDVSADLAIPCYDLPPHAGLINSAILYPLTRALFSSRARFPLAIAAQRSTALSQEDSLIWPINEAAVAGFTTKEIDVGPRSTPQPSESDINAILASVTGSLFADIDAKAAFWQRPRYLPPTRDSSQQAPTTDGPTDITPMVDAFRLAYTNLQEIWSLVLPPNSLLGLKRLYMTDVAKFSMPDTLWARIVFDFLIAYRLRTINRGHLLGALIPLYLAWVASHINITTAGTNPERHIEALAAAFEADKPYLVSRWRWPDRFNP